MDKLKLQESLIDARDSLNAALAALSQGKMFATGSHYRGALDALNSLEDE